MKETILLSGNSHQTLCNNISDIGKFKKIECEIQYFSNGEIRPVIKSSIRGKNIFIVQTCKSGNNKQSINDLIMETYLLAKTCKRSDARSITLIIPCYPYARQDKKDNPRGSISARDVADLFELAGIKRIICFDLHCHQIQGFFNIPCDNIYTHSLIINHLKNNIFKTNNVDEIRKKYVVISPDEGAVKKANSFAMEVGLPLLIISKERDYRELNKVKKMTLIGDKSQLKDKTAIIIDDMCDTFGTIKNASEHLEKCGAKDVILCITHGIFSGPAIERMNECKIVSHIICSDSISQEYNQEKCKKIQVFSIAETISSIIKKIETGDTLSTLFEKKYLM